MESPGEGRPRAREEGGGHERLAGALPAALDTGEDRWDTRVERRGWSWSVFDLMTELLAS